MLLFAITAQRQNVRRRRTASQPPVTAFADFLALLYHEARNVRHLVRDGLIEREPWRYVISLPVNRDDAWRAIRPIRDAARTALSADDVTLVFEKRFHVTVDDLVTMFGDANWRHAGSYGGNAWKSIGVSVMELRAALRDGNTDAVNELVAKIRSSSHNTGIVSDKLARLDAAARAG